MAESMKDIPVKNAAGNVVKIMFNDDFLSFHTLKVRKKMLPL